MRRPFGALFGGLAAAQVALRRLPGRRDDAQGRGIAVLALATSLAESVAARGALRGTALVVASGGIGAARRIGGAPLLAAATSTLMVRPAWVVAGLLARRRAVRVPLAAGALTSCELFTDPRAVRTRRAPWPGRRRAGAAAATRALGSLARGGGLFVAWSFADPADDPAFEGDGALAVYGWTWAAEAFAAAAGPRRPRVSLGAGAVTAAFALSALGARQRRRRGGLETLPAPLQR